MPDKRLALFADIILPAVIILATAAAFFAFAEEESGRLFYTNMAVTVWIEILFFGYIKLLNTKTRTVSLPFFASLGAGSMYYAAFALLWMLFYSFRLCNTVSYAAYITVHFAALSAWLVIHTLIARQDNAYGESVAEQQGKADMLHYYSEKMKLQVSRYRQASDKCSVTQPPGTVGMEVLSNKIRGLAPCILSDGMAQSQLTALLARCEELITALEEAQDEEAAAQADKRLRSFIKNSIPEIDMLRNLTKK